MEEGSNPNDNALQDEAVHNARFKATGYTEDVLSHKNAHVKKTAAASVDLQQVSESNTQENNDGYKQWASKTHDLRMTCNPDEWGTTSILAKNITYELEGHHPRQ